MFLLWAIRLSTKAMSSCSKGLKMQWRGRRCWWCRLFSSISSTWKAHRCRCSCWLNHWLLRKLIALWTSWRWRFLLAITLRSNLNKNTCCFNFSLGWANLRLWLELWRGKTGSNIWHWLMRVFNQSWNWNISIWSFPVWFGRDGCIWVLDQCSSLACYLCFITREGSRDTELSVRT